MLTLLSLSGVAATCNSKRSSVSMLANSSPFSSEPRNKKWQKKHDLFFIFQNVAAPPTLQPALQLLGKDEFPPLASTAPRQQAAAGWGLLKPCRLHCKLGRLRAGLKAEQGQGGTHRVGLHRSYRWSVAVCWKNDWMNKWVTFLRAAWPGTTLYLWLRVWLCLALQSEWYPGHPFMSTEPQCWASRICLDGSSTIWCNNIISLEKLPKVS